MSFAVWTAPPPFTFAENDPEQVYQVGAYWVVTDDPARATQAEVDLVINPPGPALSEQRDRTRDLKKLEDAVRDGNQAEINSLLVKILKGETG